MSKTVLLLQYTNYIIFDESEPARCEQRLRSDTKCSAEDAAWARAQFENKLMNVFSQAKLDEWLIESGLASKPKLGRKRCAGLVHAMLDEDADLEAIFRVAQ